MPRRYRKRKRSFRKRRARGMQRIRTYRYKSRNIGGDRARAKLFSLVLLMRLLLLERDTKLRPGAQTSELRHSPCFLEFPCSSEIVLA